MSSLGEPQSLDVLLGNDGRFRDIRLTCQHYFAACQIAATGDLLVTLPHTYALRMAALLPIVVRPLPLRLKPFRSSRTGTNRATPIARTSGCANVSPHSCSSAGVTDA